MATKHFACEGHLLLFAFGKCEPKPRPQVFPNQVLTTNRISEVANRNLHGFGRIPEELNWNPEQSCR